MSIIQKGYKERKLAHKIRLTFLEYYWEQLIIKMIKKILAINGKNKKNATQITFKIYAIKPEVKIKILKLYGEYCKQVFTGKYFNWKRRRDLYNRDPPNDNLNTFLK